MARFRFWMTCLLVTTPVTVMADDLIYSWMDAQGNFHFVDSAGEVPARYRKAAIERAQRGVLIGDDEGTYSRVGPSLPEAVPTDAAAAGAPTDATAAPGAPPSAPTAAPAPAAAASTAEAPKSLGERKKAHQTRIEEWELKKVQAQAGLANVDQELISARAGLSAAARQKANQLTSQKAQLEDQLREADRMLNETLPNQARREGLNAAE